MTYDYDLEPIQGNLCAEESPSPSEQVLRNIIDFARSYEALEVEGHQFNIFLN